jgi:hypothetical protein
VALRPLFFQNRRCRSMLACEHGLGVDAMLPPNSSSQRPNFVDSPKCLPSSFDTSHRIVFLPKIAKPTASQAQHRNLFKHFLVQEGIREMRTVQSFLFLTVATPSFPDHLWWWSANVKIIGHRIDIAVVSFSLGQKPLLQGLLSLFAPSAKCKLCVLQIVLFD